MWEKEGGHCGEHKRRKWGEENNSKLMIFIHKNVIVKPVIWYDNKKCYPETHMCTKTHEESHEHIKKS